MRRGFRLTRNWILLGVVLLLFATTATPFLYWGSHAWRDAQVARAFPNNAKLVANHLPRWLESRMPDWFTERFSALYEFTSDPLPAGKAHIDLSGSRLLRDVWLISLPVEQAETVFYDLSNCPNLRSVSDHVEEGTAHVSLDLSGCSAIETLHLGFAEGMFTLRGMDGLSPLEWVILPTGLLGALPESVKGLDLGPSVRDDSIDLRRFTRLEHLSLTEPGTTRYQLPDHLPSLSLSKTEINPFPYLTLPTGLRSLGISLSPHPPGNELEPIPQAWCSQIEELFLSGLSGTFDLRSVPHLRKLSAWIEGTLHVGGLTPESLNVRALEIQGLGTANLKDTHFFEVETPAYPVGLDLSTLKNAKEIILRTDRLPGPPRIDARHSIDLELAQPISDRSGIPSWVRETKTGLRFIGRR